MANPYQTRENLSTSIENYNNMIQNLHHLRDILRDETICYQVHNMSHRESGIDISFSADIPTAFILELSKRDVKFKVGISTDDYLKGDKEYKSKTYQTVMI